MFTNRPLTLVPGLCGPIDGIDSIQSCLQGGMSSKAGNQLSECAHVVRQELQRARVAVGLPTYIRKDLR